MFANFITIVKKCYPESRGAAGLVLLLKYNLQVARLELAVVPLEGESISQLCYTCFLLFNTRGGEPLLAPGLIYNIFRYF